VELGAPLDTPLDTEVAIETPEHIVFRHRVAGPARRLFAYVLDLVICYGAFSAIAMLVMLAAAGAGAAANAFEEARGAGIGVLLLLLFAIQWVYFALLEAWRGVTPGKSAFGLRVLTVTGRPIGLREAVLRNVLRAADSLPLTYTAGLVSLAGLASMSATRRFQRLGDIVAGTIVVVPSRSGKGAPLELWPRLDPRELAGLRGPVRLDADEREAIELFLRRRPQLGPARQRELASMIAPALCARFGIAVADPSRALAVLYDCAASAERSGGEGEGPPSLEGRPSWR
jgi:uncharacterized RDD family membrane protein YckC